MRQRHFIKQWRKHRGFSQEQLADTLDISRPQLSKIESNTREADLSLLERIADALDCQVPDLIIRDPSRPETLWSLWPTLSPSEQDQLVEVGKALKRVNKRP